MKVRPNDTANAGALELKYCERCGGLWLRPVSGAQIYCTGCAPAMAELPPSSREPEDTDVSQRARWIYDSGEDYEMALELSGGAS